MRRFSAGDGEGNVGLVSTQELVCDDVLPVPGRGTSRVIRVNWVIRRGRVPSGSRRASAWSCGFGSGRKA